MKHNSINDEEKKRKAVADIECNPRRFVHRDYRMVSDP